MKSVLSLMMFLAMITPARAGNEGGKESGGGNAVVCFKDSLIPAEIRDPENPHQGELLDKYIGKIVSIEAYDLYEAKLPRGFGSQVSGIVPVRDGEDHYGYFEKLIRRTETAIPALGARLRMQLNRFPRERNDLFVMEPFGVAKVDDVNAAGLLDSEHCVLATVIVQRKSGDETRLHIDQRLFLHPLHSELSKGVLFTHEMVYDIYRGLNERDSSNARTLVGYLIMQNDWITIGVIASFFDKTMCVARADQCVVRPLRAVLLDRMAGGASREAPGWRYRMEHPDPGILARAEAEVLADPNSEFMVSYRDLSGQANKLFAEAPIMEHHYGSPPEGLHSCGSTGSSVRECQTLLRVLYWGGVSVPGEVVLSELLGGAAVIIGPGLLPTNAQLWKARGLLVEFRRLYERLAPHVVEQALKMFEAEVRPLVDSSPLPDHDAWNESLRSMLRDPEVVAAYRQGSTQRKLLEQGLIQFGPTFERVEDLLEMKMPVLDLATLPLPAM